MAMRFRQVHLDFHTGPEIPDVGSRFDKAAFQDALRLGHVDSITLFSKCHHGWSYHPTQTGAMHPALSFDLLRAQIGAAKEIGVATPVYLSAGFDERLARLHPEWLCRDENGAPFGFGKTPAAAPGYHMLCFRSPYLGVLCDQIREVCRLFPEADGIFLDIVDARQCHCEWCRRFMEGRGLDYSSEADVASAAEDTLRLYCGLATAAARELRHDMPVFHNSGNVGPAFRRKGLLQFFSHLELESLPTGGWGYDHFPLGAKYVATLGLDYLGMTGKFHRSWGEFGGFKHPNALRAECAAMLAFGAKCSVGDQLHPSGEMDRATYAAVGAAYAEVEAKEPWCRGVRNVADVGVLQVCGMPDSQADRPTPSDTGAGRALLEGHVLFDMLDSDSDFSRYRLLVLPDAIRCKGALLAKLRAYVAAGGKLLLSGTSGLDENRTRFLFDVGADTDGLSPFSPDYALPREGLRAPFASSPVVMHGCEGIPGGGASQRLKVTDGESLGDVFDPYFNRAWNHFCSHQHTPNRPEASGFACGVRKGGVAYLAHPVFALYAREGAAAVREYVLRVLRDLLGDPSAAVGGLPSTGRMTLLDQPGERRSVLHLVYAPTAKRGGIGAPDVEVVEDLPALHGVSVEIRRGVPSGHGGALAPARRARLVPDGKALPLMPLSGGGVRIALPPFSCHAMVELS